jgi:competence protein ComEA
MKDQSGKVNLNTASREELGRIKGVGDECARRIIAERERRGGFKDVSEMDSMEFGPQTVRHLKEQATV